MEERKGVYGGEERGAWRRGKRCVVGWLAGWLVGWMVGWLVGWLAGWLVGWLVAGGMLVAGDWWLVVGGWWLVAGGWSKGKGEERERKGRQGEERDDAALSSNAHPFRFNDAPTLFVGLHGSKMIGLRFAINGFRL